jgi:hypothetical protein
MRAKPKLKAEKSSARRTTIRRDPTAELALSVAHHLNNIIGAMSLRLSVVASDPSCRRAQGANIDSLQRILQEGRELITSLERQGRAASARPPRETRS